MRDSSINSWTGSAGRDCAPRRRAGGKAGRRSDWGSASWSRKAGSGRARMCASCSIRDGRVEVVTGAASIGQGVETVLAQICADGLGVGLDRIRVVHGQTDQIARGMGAFASRVTVMTGAAVTLAAEKLRQALLIAAGRLLQMAPARLGVAG